MTKYYSDVTPAFYFSFVFLSILFPLSCLFISEKIKELFILMKTNKDLIHTVRTILQQFPEGVIIRSVDPISKQTINKFANDMANKVICRDPAEEVPRENILVKIIHSDKNNQNRRFERIGNIDEFLYHQEVKIMEQEDFK